MSPLCGDLSAPSPEVALAACCNLAYRRHLVEALAGNASVRLPDGFLCTPTGCCLGEVRPEDLVHLDVGWLAVRGRPSSEWRLHAHIYRADPMVGSVLHTHSHWATACAVLGWDVEPLTPEIEHHLGRVPCLPYAPPGTDQVGSSVAEAMAGGARAALLGRHGAVAWGRDIREAFAKAEVLEAASRLQCALAGLRGGET